MSHIVLSPRDVHVPGARVVPERFCIATAPLLVLVLLQSVLKWLHHPLGKYVMLLHAASFWHDCLHRSRLDCCPDDCPRYFSPAPMSHIVLSPRDVHVPGARVVPERFCIATAPLLVLVLLQSVLKWLHHPLGKYVMLVHAASFWHDCLHRSRLDCCPDDCPRYFSPAPMSHIVLSPRDVHAPAARVVPERFCIATAPLLVLVLLQSVLKWL